MAVAALAGLGGGIAVVGAHDVEYLQTVGYHTGTSDPGDRYKVKGDVGSLSEKCEPGRTVRFFRERTGRTGKRART